MPRRFLKSHLAGVSHWTGADRLLGGLTGFRGAPLVLGYHRVVERFALHAARTMPPMLIDLGMLEKQLDWVSRQYRLVSLDELGARLEGGEPAGGLATVTFDDGYRDFYEQALPLLRRKGIPAAVFVVTDALGTGEILPHDRLYLLLDRARARSRDLRRDVARLLGRADLEAGGEERLPDGDTLTLTVFLLDRLPQAALHRLIRGLETEGPLTEAETEAVRPLTWPMLAEIQAQGVTVGSHSRSHALLPQEGAQDEKEEIAASREVLVQRLGRGVLHFAYPAGGFDEETVEAVRSAGYRFGFTTCRHRSPRHPLLTIPRILLWQGSALDARGRFSSSVLSCLANGVLPLTDRCRAHHGQPDRRYEVGQAS